MKSMRYAFLFALFLVTSITTAHAQSGPAVVDPDLEVRTAVEGLELPTSIAFLGDNDLFVLEKNTGKVQHVVDGVIVGTVLDLAVNFFSERGLLGIALHPDFPTNPGVYLYWSCRSLAPPSDPFIPDQEDCSNSNMLGADTEEALEVPLLGNRVDRFEWNGSTLTFDQHLITFRSFQNDAAPEPPNQGDAEQPERGNHDAGVIAFGPDQKLYIAVGDVGRRGQLQNLPSGPTLTGLGDPVPDDQFGGPEPDNAHFTGVIVRLNDDGSTPTDNPFFDAGATIDGEVGANIQKIFSYGIRNTFGMAFDPESGNLWYQDNGEDAFDELNLVKPGSNLGWIQIMGPIKRLDEFKQIETTSLHNEDFPNLQQFRWGPERIADSKKEAKSRLFLLPGAKYNDPELSWKFVIAPAAIGFQDGQGIGKKYDGDLFVGLSTLEIEEGSLLRFDLNGSRRKIDPDSPGLRDRVDDNPDFAQLGESAGNLFGTGFGIVTDIETGPNGNLYVVSLSSGVIYEILRN